VTTGSGFPVVLIVDDDMGFVMWLGEVFTEVGCQTLPALRCRQGLLLAKQFDLRIDALVLNPKLPGAERLVKVLSDAQPALRIALIQDHGHSAAVSRTSLERPCPWDPISRDEWVAKARRLVFGASANH
jgi:DNA-binding NtrC family response regulator